jgi:hypothetical protein
MRLPVGAKHLDDYLSGNPQISISKCFALLVSMENEEGEAFGLKNLEKNHKLSLECFAPTTPFYGMASEPEIIEVAEKFVLANCYNPKIAMKLFDDS